MLKHKVLILLVATMLLCGGFLRGQEQTGEIIGTVLLEDGSALPGVSVEISGEKLIGNKVTVTTDNGTYRLMGIPTGIYTVSFSLDGFKTTKRKGVRVDLGKTFKLDAIMQTGEIKEEVVVTGQIPLVDVRKSATAVNITKESFSKLPKSSRNFLSIATQQAGVNYERNFDNSAQGDFDTERGTAISFDGASAGENTFFIDGMDTTTMEGGVSGNNLTTDFIEEVQVKSSGYAAEYGGSMGGVISVITRSGGNEFHGDLGAYYDSDFLQGKPRSNLILDPADSTRALWTNYSVDKWNRVEPGLSLGGYVIKDKVWFFGSFMPSYRNRERVGTFRAMPSMDGTKYDFQDIRYNGALKLTAAIGQNIRVSASGNINIREQKKQLPEQDGTSNPTDANIWAWDHWAQKDPEANASLNMDYSIGNIGFWTVGAGYYRTNQYFSGERDAPITRLRMANTNAGLPGIPTELVRAGGWGNTTWAAIKEDLRDITLKYSAKTDLTLYFSGAGDHVAKAGFGWNRVKLDKYKTAINTPDWYFRWKQTNGLYHTYLDTQGVAHATTYGYASERGPYGSKDTGLTSDRYNLYVQDSWTIGDKLTVNYGVRLEKESMPSMSKELPNDPFSFGFFDKFAPRLGFAYDFKGDGVTKIFGSFGIYYDVMKLDMAVGSFGGFIWKDSWYDIGTMDWTQYANQRGFSFTGSTAPILGGQFYEVIDHRVPSHNLVQPDMKAGSKMEISFGLQRKISDDVSFTARFLHHKLLNVIEDIGVKIGTNENYYIGNPGSDWINEQYALSATQGNIPVGVKCPKPMRTYYSVQLSLDKKFSKNWLGGMTLTWSSLKGNMAGLASSEENGRQNPMVMRYFDYWFLHYDSHMNSSDGVLPTDRPLDFKVYGAYTFNFGLTVGVNGFVKSGTPVSTDFTLNNQQGYFPNGRGDLGRTPVLWQIDLYLEYNLKLSSKFNLNLNANITNLTNNKIAQRVYNLINGQNVVRTNDQIFAGFEVDELMSSLNIPVDPRFDTPYFFTAPIAVRLGAKLSF